MNNWSFYSQAASVFFFFFPACSFWFLFHFCSSSGCFNVEWRRNPNIVNRNVWINNQPNRKKRWESVYYRRKSAHYSDAIWLYPIFNMLVHPWNGLHCIDWNAAKGAATATVVWTNTCSNCCMTPWWSMYQLSQWKWHLSRCVEEPLYWSSRNVTCVPREQVLYFVLKEEKEKRNERTINDDFTCVSLPCERSFIGVMSNERLKNGKVWEN